MNIILILVLTTMQGRYNLTPLSYEALDHSSSFASEQCPEGFCAVAKNTLRILSLERLGESFNQQVSTMLSSILFSPKTFCYRESTGAGVEHSRHGKPPQIAPVFACGVLCDILTNARSGKHSVTGYSLCRQRFLHVGLA